MVYDAFDQRVGQAVFHRTLPPTLVDRNRLALLLDGFGKGEQPVGGIGPPVQQDIFDQFEEVFRDFFVDRQLSRVHNAHVQPGADGMVEKSRVHGLAHGVVASKREGDVADPPAHLAQRQVSFDPARRLDKIHRVVVVLLHSRGHRQDIGIEDDILWRKTNVHGQDAIGAGADLDLALHGVCLARFVKGHHDCRSAIPLHQFRKLPKGRLTFLQADRIDDGLALHTFHAGLDDGPLGAVNHDRHARNVRLGGDEFQEGGHRLPRIQHAFVHVHVDNLGPAFDLLPCHR